MSERWETKESKEVTDGARSWDMQKECTGGGS